MPQELYNDLKRIYAQDINQESYAAEDQLTLTVNGQKILELSLFIRDALGGTLVSLVANDERRLNGNFALYYVWSFREHAALLQLKTLIEPNTPSFISLTCNIHQANLYEREIHDLFGLIPQGHPDLRSMVFHGRLAPGHYPLRKDYEAEPELPYGDVQADFQEVQGPGVFEIPVGPIHAGIIEPGHFRFSVAGEPIINLEARLYYVHKGLEKLAEGMSFQKGLFLAERISGDETFANALAYCQALEAVGGLEVPLRAQYSRVILAELERLTAHLGDLGGVCLDVAYGFAVSQFRLMRIWCYLLIEEVAESRFMRSVNALGGLRRDFIAGKEQLLLDRLHLIETELQDTVKIVRAHPLLIDRIENTGVLSKTAAQDLHAVGPGGRASGQPGDVRKDLPYAAYGRLDFTPSLHNNGDVNCRMNVKIEECFTAIQLIRQALECMPPSGDIGCLIPEIAPYRWALGYCEAPRGENIHWLMTGEHNTLYRYKVRTPSFCNWPAVCQAVKGNIVPDFPIINKSFNLSYAGNDL